jgi:ankyrin repeat protein
MNKGLFFLFVFFSFTLIATPENDFLRANLSGDYEKVVELYEKEGLRLTYTRDKDGNTPLHIACCSKKGGSKGKIVSFLIDKGVNVNAQNNYESTPLAIAVSNGNYEATQLLLASKGIRINQTYQQNFTPLHIAVISQIPPLIKLLLSHPDINPNFGTSDGATPLHYAAMQGLVEEAKILIDHPRTDINAPQHDTIYSGATPLHFASMQAQAEIVSYLLSNPTIQVNATINKGAQTGFTPLHYAVLNPDTVNVLEVVNLLMDHGADPNVKCEAGKTPFDLTAVSIIQKALVNHKKKRK